MLIIGAPFKLLYKRRVSSSYIDGSIRQQIYNKYTYQNKKKWKKGVTIITKVNTLHSSKMYNAAMNGNVKHKTCVEHGQNNRVNWLATAVFTTSFYCASAVLYVDLSSSFCEFKKLLQFSYWLLTGRQFSK